MDPELKCPYCPTNTIINADGECMVCGKVLSKWAVKTAIAFREGVAEVIKEHHAAGRSVASWEDGKVVYILPPGADPMHYCKECGAHKGISECTNCPPTHNSLFQKFISTLKRMLK